MGRGNIKDAATLTTVPFMILFSKGESWVRIMACPLVRAKIETIRKKKERKGSGIVNSLFDKERNKSVRVC